VVDGRGNGLGGEGASRCEELPLRQAVSVSLSYHSEAQREWARAHQHDSDPMPTLAGTWLLNPRGAVVRMVPTDAGLDLSTNEAQIKRVTVCGGSRCHCMRVTVCGGSRCLRQRARVPVRVHRMTRADTRQWGALLLTTLYASNRVRTTAATCQVPHSATVCLDVSSAFVQCSRGSFMFQ